MFPIVCFLTQQILKIVGSQIEIKKIFSLVGISPTLENVTYNQKTWRN
jgi:hypothetical protein